MNNNIKTCTNCGAHEIKGGYHFFLGVDLIIVIIKEEALQLQRSEKVIDFKKRYSALITESQS